MALHSSPMGNLSGEQGNFIGNYGHRTCIMQGTNYFVSIIKSTFSLPVQKHKFKRKKLGNEAVTKIKSFAGFTGKIVKKNSPLRTNQFARFGEFCRLANSENK